MMEKLKDLEAISEADERMEYIVVVDQAAGEIRPLSLGDIYAAAESAALDVIGGPENIDEQKGTPVEKKWLHLQLLGSDPWVLPMRNAINQAVRDGRMPEPGKEFNELCSNVSLRLSLLPRVAMRISKGWASLREAIKGAKSGTNSPSANELTRSLTITI